MLRLFNNKAILNSKSLFLRATATRAYYKDDVLMPRDQGEYYSDPMAVAERVVRLIALHDACRDPANVTVSHSFEQLGLNALDMCEVFIGCEREFDLEIAEEACEEMNTVNDLVEFLSKNPATK
jgi:acyl carrier protein